MSRRQKKRACVPAQKRVCIPLITSSHAPSAPPPAYTNCATHIQGPAPPLVETGLYGSGRHGTARPKDTTCLPRKPFLGLPAGGVDFLDGLCEHAHDRAPAQQPHPAQHQQMTTLNLSLLSNVCKAAQERGEESWKSWVTEGCALVLLRLGQKVGDLLLHGALQRRGRLGVAGLLRPQPDTRSASAKRWMQPGSGRCGGGVGGRGVGGGGDAPTWRRRRRTPAGETPWSPRSSPQPRHPPPSGECRALEGQSAHAKHTRTAAAQTQPHPGVRRWSGRPASQRSVSPPLTAPPAPARPPPGQLQARSTEHNSI